MDLILYTNNPYMREQALKAWEERNIMGVLCSMENTAGLAFVFDNIAILKEAGKYEEALMMAYTGTRVNWSGWGLDVIKFMFNRADRGKLAEAGDPIPEKDMFQVYRGVGGNGRARRVQGFSWTGSLERALWFANRAKVFGLNDPAVFTVTVPRESILTYCNDRQEEEYLLSLPLPSKPKRVKIDL